MQHVLFGYRQPHLSRVPTNCWIHRPHPSHARHRVFTQSSLQHCSSEGAGLITWRKAAQECNGTGYTSSTQSSPAGQSVYNTCRVNSKCEGPNTVQKVLQSHIQGKDVFIFIVREFATKSTVVNESNLIHNFHCATHILQVRQYL